MEDVLSDLPVPFHDMLQGVNWRPVFTRRCDGQCAGGQGRHGRGESVVAFANVGMDVID